MKKFKLCDFIELKIIESTNYWKMYRFVIKNRLSFFSDKVFLASEYNFRIHVFIQIFLSKNLEILGDGASLIWDDPKPENLSTRIKYFFFKTLFKIKSPSSLSKTRDRNFFKKNWSFLKDNYSKLPVLNKCWIFGTSLPFVKPGPRDFYSELAHEFYQSGGWTKDKYIDWINNLASFLEKERIEHIYFPHPLEKKSDFQNVNFEISSNYSEFLPFHYGYLPKYIFASSTTAFNFLNIKRNASSSLRIFVISHTERINSWYKKYDAEIYFPGQTVVEIK
ncbi:MAG: hypothetical protein ACOYXC_22165 [Candidatus Rifleibacteriota bacterium]